MQIINTTHIETDLGMMLAASTNNGICLLEFTDSKHLDLELKQLSNSLKAQFVQADNEYLLMLRKQLHEYFAEERKVFDIPLDLVGTEFQKQVWLSLLHIPYGSTTSYLKQAEFLGKPSVVRAVANANGKNKISIVLPCHRVIGTNGSLTGYGGGIWRKKILLDLEKNVIKDNKDSN